MRRITAFSPLPFLQHAQKDSSQLFFREDFAEPCYSGTIRGSKPISQKKKPRQEAGFCDGSSLGDIRRIQQRRPSGNGTRGISFQEEAVSGTYRNERT